MEVTVWWTLPYLPPQLTVDIWLYLLYPGSVHLSSISTMLTFFKKCILKLVADRNTPSYRCIIDWREYLSQPFYSFEVRFTMEHTVHKCTFGWVSTNALTCATQNPAKVQAIRHPRNAFIFLLLNPTPTTQEATTILIILP